MSGELIKRYFRDIVHQTRILLKKNTILYLRRWRSTVLQLLVPVVFALLLLALSRSIRTDANKELHPRSLAIGKIPKCAPYMTSYCYSLAWATNNSVITPQVSTIVDTIVAESGLPTDMVRQFSSESEMSSFIINNQNTTIAGVAFYALGSSNTYAYNLYMNTSTELIGLGPNYQNAIDSALVKWEANMLGDSSYQPLKFGMRGYPNLPPAISGEVIVFNVYGAVFFFCAIFFQFMVILGNVVAEKEGNLRLGMNMMGLRDFTFWWSWMLTSVLMNAISALLLVIFGMIIGQDFFTNANFGVLFCLFWLFGIAMTPFAFFVSTFMSTSKTSSTVGFIILIIGVLFEFIAANGFAIYSWWDPSTTPAPRIVFYFFAPFNFAKVFADINRLASSRLNSATGQYEKGPGFSAADLYRFQPRDGDLISASVRDNVPPPSDALGLLVMNLVLYYFLAWYFDNVFGGTGVKKSPWFFLEAEFWGLEKKGDHQEVAEPLLRDDDDSDVAAEARQAHKASPESVGVQVMRLVKRYGDFNAVDNVSYCIPKDSLFAMLGHNGAGKTTTINMLVGLFPPTTGDAYIFGKSIRRQMDDIRKVMGVCPQHDILWPDLTAREHLKMFCEFKGVPASEMDAEIEKRLADVNLSTVADKNSETFSGGMKRRLSVAISCIGNPQIIFLDEPSTGMDPASRRRVWELIHTMKKGRVILLTTHSMEEADALSDRIAIMGGGRIRCIGDSLRLKARFGKGYSVHLVTDVTKIPAAKKLVETHLPKATLLADNAGNLVYNYVADTSDPEALSRFLGVMEETPTDLVRDFGVSQTTLEEVFLTVTQASHYTIGAMEETHAPSLSALSQSVPDLQAGGSGHGDGAYPIAPSK